MAVPHPELGEATRQLALRVNRIFKSSPTVGSVMDESNGAGPGFDALRIGLSLAILVWHCFPVAIGGTTGQDMRDSGAYPLVLAMLPLFFCLSGFLVTGSALRTASIKVFLGNRGLRIIPALAVEVTLAALILGPILTTLPLADYFADWRFRHYFGNILGMVSVELPGVFATNPLRDMVNANLWTLRPEYYCYLYMLILMATTVVYKRSMFTKAFAAALLIASFFNVTHGFGLPPLIFPDVVLEFYFIAGVTLFHWRHYIPLRAEIFALSAAWVYFVLPTGWTFISVFPVGYFMLYLGMLRVPKIPLFQNGDYSYGIYLFGFPIQQTIVYLFPSLREWWLLLLVSLPLTIIFAAFSWHIIEKPTLAMRKHLKPKGQLPKAECAAPG